MSLSAWEQQTLDSIRDGIAGSDPQLAALLTTFTRLASNEEMPARENLGESSRRVTRCSLRKRRRRYRSATARRLGLQRGALLLWLLVTVAVIAVAVGLSRGGQGSSDSQAKCTGSWTTLCAGSAPTQRPNPHVA